MTADVRLSRSGARLSQLYSSPPEWTTAVLWHGIYNPALPVGPIEAEIDSLIDQRLAPLTLRYLKDTNTKVDAASMRKLRDSAFGWFSLSLGVTESALGVVDSLARHGIEVAVSKGPGIAALYPRPEDRPFSDIDLLVDSDDFARSLLLLQKAGWVENEASRQPWRFFDTKCREAVNLARRPGEGVDLHHHIPPWIWSEKLDIDRMIERAHVQQRESAARLPHVAVEDNLLIAALHIVSDKNKPGKTLIIWRDLAELARFADPELAAARARDAGLDGWLRRVLQALPGPAQPTVLLDLLSDAAMPRHSARLNRLLSVESSSVVTSQFLRLPLPNGVAFVSGMIVPSRTFLRVKMGRGKFSYLTWWKSSLRRRPEAT